ncbi:hypothetical protein ACSBR2_031777 [Camellia fascicularis]
MDDGILLLCTYLQINAIIRLYHGLSFGELVNSVCVKFGGLVPGEVYMLFDVPRYKNFKVDSNNDIQNMLCLAKTFGLNHIDVLIQARSVDAGGRDGVVD